MIGETAGFVPGTDMNSHDQKTRIVILGGGFGGAYCARRLEKRLRPENAEITLVNRTNYFVFTPLLVEAGTGALEPRHAVVPLHGFLKRTRLLTAELTGIDLEQRTIRTETFLGEQKEVAYDHLVIALGSVTRLPAVPGLREYAFGLKSLADAVALRDRAVGMLELANDTSDPELKKQLLTFVIVGGNYTGVEVAGEFNEFLHESTRLYRNISRDEIRVVLVEREPRILPMLDEDLSRFASTHLQKRGVELRLENTVNRITADSVELKAGERIPTSTVIWTAGVAPNPLIADSGLPCDQRGYLVCEPDLRVKDFDNLWAVGDIASNPDPQGNAYPPTAQHAIREGVQAAENIERALHGHPTEALVYRSRGMMAPLGYHQGVARIMRWKFSGLPAWFLWRTFYLLKMPGFTRGIRVMVDWTLSWFFRRDYVQLGLHGTHRPSAASNIAAGRSQNQAPETESV